MKLVIPLLIYKIEKAVQFYLTPFLEKKITDLSRKKERIQNYSP